MNTISDLSQLSQQALDQFKKSLAASNRRQGDPRVIAEVSKAGINQATGLVWYDLQSPAKNLFPVLTPLRNRIPRVPGGGGTATNWISVTAINALGLRGFVPEGIRNGLVTTTATPKSASYKSFGLEDSVTFEAELAAENFENVRATTGQRLLWATMIEEEVSDLGANGDSILLDVPVLGVPVADAAGGTIPAAAHYYMNVFAVTHHGYLGSSLATVPDLVSVTPADGSAAFTYGAGLSKVSNQADITTLTPADTWGVHATCTQIPGAIAYLWFLGTSTNNGKLQKITTINSVSITSYVTASRAALPTGATDYSKNAYAYDGLLYQAYKSGSGAYVAHLAAGTAGVGTGLTGDGAGGIVEIDAMFKDRWDNYRLSVDEIFVNSQEAKNITKKVLGTGTTYPNMHLVVQNTVDAQGNIVAGARVASILNKFAQTGKQDVPITIHPNMPPGTMMGVTWSLPYPVNNVPNIFEKKLRRDYYQMEWPLRTRKYESGVYFDGVLALYFPPAIDIIDNIADV
jgi:hypothetical protein